MYKVIKEGVLLGKVENPLYVRKKNGIWIESEKKDAEAVSFNGFVYPIDEIILYFEDVGEQIGSTDVDLANLELKIRLALQEIVNVMITNKCRFTKEELESMKDFLLVNQVEEIENNLLNK